MRVPARLCAALSATTFATASIAQPYGVMSPDPGYWHPLGHFDDAINETGPNQAYSHWGYNAGFTGISSVWIAVVFDHEQFEKGHGSYWQYLLYLTFK